MVPKNAKHPPVSAIVTIPVAIPIAPNPNGLHVATSNAGRSAVHYDEDSKPDPIISTDLTLQDDPTRLTNNGDDTSKRKARSIHMHTTCSERTTKRPKTKQDRPPMSDSEDNSSNDEDRKPAAITTPTPDGAPSSTCPSNDEDRKPAAKDTPPTPDGVPSTCAGLKRKSTSTRTESVVSTRGRGIKLEPVIKMETAPANLSTDEAEASIPTETVINGPNLNRTVTVHRKVAKRTDPLYIAPPPPQNIAVPLSTRRRSRRQIQLPPIRTSAVQLDYSAELSGPVSPPPPPPATVKALARRRSSHRVIPTSSTATPIPPPRTATLYESTRRRSPRQTQLPPIETREAHLDHSDEFDGANDGDGDLAGPSWKDRLSELADYRKMHGHCSVPVRYSENTKLGTWVMTQRSNYKLHLEGKRSPMTTFRIQKLESLGFEWSSRGTLWGDRLGELGDYRKIHGHCNVPKRYSENTKLGYWVNKQRGQYSLHLKGYTSPLTPSRIHELDSMGFEWDRSAPAWEDRFSELADYHRIHGHCNVPQCYSENIKLGRWVQRQRSSYKLYQEGNTSPLTSSRIQELERLGFE
jgi:hypothetical protein